MERRVVVTGMGMICGVGNTTDEMWASLLAGKSGVAPITFFDTSQHSCTIAAEVKNFDPLNFIEKKDVKKMGRFIYHAMAAATEAMSSSGLKITDANAEDIGTYIGSGIGGFDVIERAAIVNLASGQVSIRFGAKGPNMASATACATGAHAIGDSYKIIQRGDAIAMIAGGAEAAITPMSIGGFASMRALSTRNNEPERASRPWDKDRDGFVVGEGAGVLILEELEFAKARGARILGEIVGYGMSGDAYHITSPAPGHEGAFRVMRNALRDAKLTPADIGYVNAHGTGTRLNDSTETLILKRVFGAEAHRVRPRHLDSDGRRTGGGGGPQSFRRLQGAGQLHQIHDRPSSGRRWGPGGRHYPPCAARSDPAAHHQPGKSG